MKLQNRKSGEIGELQITEKHCAVSVGNGTASCGIVIYSSLAELNAEWQDYEEPKDSEYYWYIGYKNDIRRTKYHHISDFADNQVTATRKEIGNCFESLEEAELAVRKLKAWKRLKDKGFRFNSCKIEMREIIVPEITITAFIDTEQPEMLNLVNLLFGGEE